MKTHRREAAEMACLFRSAARGRPVVELPAPVPPWTSDDLYHTIRLLSDIAHDEEICARNPALVIEALQNHGHLLCDDAIEMLRDWLTQLSRNQARPHRNPHPRPQ